MKGINHHNGNQTLSLPYNNTNNYAKVELCMLRQSNIINTNYSFLRVDQQTNKAVTICSSEQI